MASLSSWRRSNLAALDFATVCGFAAAIAGTTAFMPQAVRCIRTGDTRSISLTTAASFVAAIILWILHGWSVGSWPLLLCNLAALVPNGVILLIKINNIRHGRA